MVVAAVHRATSELLGEAGYDALELPDVATRAGVAKSTVYRRWPTKMHLVADTMLATAAQAVLPADTGTLIDDLIALISDIVELLGSPAVRAALTGVTAGDLDPVAKAAREAFWNERFRCGAVIVDRAIARGEIPAATSPRLLLEHACSPVYFRLLVTGDPVGPADIELFARRAAAFPIAG
ncbi:TetR/AcrR family transcriptional regulator [Amycolatopsis sp. NPDC101161]|uniref:TetR/AcrR family transcriptional regulator n=1 Tax=Amycolatopsis sp. NPDC101161 TaxID=3363940 RepID=UPI00381E92E2